jgi:enamine deaminase RidA (YjgF/YER057c/UK114 family)
MSAADQFLAAQRQSILDDVATAISENPIEVGVVLDPEDNLSRARAISSLLIKDKDSGYPYRAGLYIAAWKNGLQDASWVSETFQDNLGRIPAAAQAAAKAVESQAAGVFEPEPTREHRILGEGAGLVVGAVTAGHLMAHYLYPAIRKFMPVKGVAVNATKWILSEPNVWVDTFLKFEAGATDLSGWQFVKQASLDQLVLRTIGKDFPTMRSASKICFDAFNSLTNVPGPTLKKIFGGSETSPLKTKAVQVNFLKRTQEILFEMTKQDTPMPRGEAFFDLLTIPANPGATNSQAYTRFAAVARAYKAAKSNTGDTFEVALPGGATKFTKAEGQIAYDFFVQYASGVEKMVGVFRYLRLPAQALALGGLIGTTIAIHMLSDYLYTSTFIGVDHLPVDIADETLAAIFTAATVRETCHDALSDVISDTDYLGDTLEKLKKADDNLLVLLSRALDTPTTPQEMADASVLYDQAELEIKAL